MQLQLRSLTNIKYVYTKSKLNLPALQSCHRKAEVYACNSAVGEHLIQVPI